MVKAGMGFWSSRAEGFVDNDLNCALDLKRDLRGSARFWCDHVGKCARMGMESECERLLFYQMGSQEVDSNCVFLSNGVVCDCIGNGSATRFAEVQWICRRSLSDGNNCAAELHLLVAWSEEKTHDVCGEESSPPGNVE